MTRPPADPDSSRNGPETRHVFGQDSDPIGEFCSLNVVYHLFSETQKGRKFFVVVIGVLDPSTAPKWGANPALRPSAILRVLCVKDNISTQRAAEIRRERREVEPIA